MNVVHLIAFMSLWTIGSERETNEPDPKKSFEMLRLALPAIVKQSGLAEVRSDEKQQKMLEYSRIRVARRIDEAKAKITLSFHMIDARENEPDALITLSLSYFEGKWAVSTSEYSDSFKRFDESEKVKKLILYIDEFTDKGTSLPKK